MQFPFYSPSCHYFWFNILYGFTCIDLIDYVIKEEKKNLYIFFTLLYFFNMKYHSVFYKTAAYWSLLIQKTVLKKSWTGKTRKKDQRPTRHWITISLHFTVGIHNLKRTEKVICSKHQITTILLSLYMTWTILSLVILYHSFRHNHSFVLHTTQLRNINLKTYGFFFLNYV